MEVVIALSNKNRNIVLLLAVALAPIPAAAQVKKAAAPAQTAKAAADSATPACLNHIGQKEWAILAKDLSASALKTLETPEGQKAQIENLRQLLAMSCEARKLGLDQEETNAGELEYVGTEARAVVYDDFLSKDKTAAPFARITDAQIDAFYKTPGREAEFERFLQVKTDLIRRANPDMQPNLITYSERSQAREYYAKITLGEKAKTLVTPAVRAAADLRAQFQQAQFLARLYSENLIKDIEVSDAQVASYIASHPEFDVTAKKEKASKILARAKSGEDFAALANEFSEDPGNTGTDGKKNGGLYSNVPLGRMVPQFEKASLALKPGEVSDLVQTDFGFHVIKLEKKTGTTYDVRHILISTMFVDPNDPNGRDVPASVYVRSKLEEERVGTLIDQVVAKNPVVIEDYKPATVVATKPASAVTTRPASRVVRKKR